VHRNEESEQSGAEIAWHHRAREEREAIPEGKAREGMEMTYICIDIDI